MQTAAPRHTQSRGPRLAASGGDRQPLAAQPALVNFWVKARREREKNWLINPLRPGQPSKSSFLSVRIFRRNWALLVGTVRPSQRRFSTCIRGGCPMGHRAARVCRNANMGILSPCSIQTEARRNVTANPPGGNRRSQVSNLDKASVTTHPNSANPENHISPPSPSALQLQLPHQLLHRQPVVRCPALENAAARPGANGIMIWDGLMVLATCGPYPLFFLISFHGLEAQSCPG